MPMDTRRALAHIQRATDLLGFGTTVQWKVGNWTEGMEIEMISMQEFKDILVRSQRTDVAAFLHLSLHLFTSTAGLHREPGVLERCFEGAKMLCGVANECQTDHHMHKTEYASHRDLWRVRFEHVTYKYISETFMKWDVPSKLEILMHVTVLLDSVCAEDWKAISETLQNKLLRDTTFIFTAYSTEHYRNRRNRKRKRDEI